MGMTGLGHSPEGQNESIFATLGEEKRERGIFFGTNKTKIQSKRKRHHVFVPMAKSIAVGVGMGCRCGLQVVVSPQQQASSTAMQTVVRCQLAPAHLPGPDRVYRPPKL